MAVPGAHRPDWETWSRWGGILAIATVFVVAVSSGRPFVYDERAYIEDGIATFDRWGFSWQALRGYPQPAGFLFGLIHWALRSVTALEPRAVRALNPLLLLAVVAACSAMLRRARGESAFSIAVALAAVPPLWVLSGLALTEMVGVAAAVCGNWLFVGVVSSPAWSVRARLTGAFVGGALIGLAFYSRPPLTLVGVAVAAVFALNPRQRLSVAALFAGMIVVVAPAVVVWGGLVPPNVQFFETAEFSARNAVLSLGYGAVMMALIAPAFFRLPFWIGASAIAAGVCADLATKAVQVQALRTVASLILSEEWLAVYGLVVGACVSGAAVLFVVTLAYRLATGRHGDVWVASVVAASLLLASVGKITHQYSSRYAAVSAPWLVLASEPFQTFTPATAFLRLLGYVLGGASLLSYLLA